MCFGGGRAVSAKDRTAVLALGGGVALCAVALIAYSQFGEDGQGTRSGPAPQQAHVPRGATKVPAAQAQALRPVSGGAATVPAALVNAPRQLSLERYELTPATFFAWRDYVAGSPKDQLWQRIAWRASLWDAV